MTREGENATIIQHCAVFGTLKTAVRKFKVREPRPYAQHPISVDVDFVEPRKRRWAAYRMMPVNYRYLTIERDGVVLYDSRQDVPCDMEEWRKLYDKNKAEWLARQAEIDKENAAAPPGVTIRQMGDFRD
jgi:hypothetical protein